MKWSSQASSIFFQDTATAAIWAPRHLPHDGVDHEPDCRQRKRTTDYEPAAQRRRVPEPDGVHSRRNRFQSLDPKRCRPKRSRRSESMCVDEVRAPLTSASMNPFYWSVHLLGTPKLQSPLCIERKSDRIPQVVSSITTRPNINSGRSPLTYIYKCKRPRSF